MSILCYHSVDPTWRSPLAVTPEEFDRQCAWLARHRRVVDVDRATTMLDRRFMLPAGTAAITFDDGFAGLAAHAAPILRKHRLPAMVFLVAGTLAAAPKRYEWVDGEPPPEPGTLNLDQVLEMQEAGIAFGSHSMNHNDLTHLSDAECEADLTGSKELLCDLLGRPSRFLAYPGGRHDERVRRIAARAGYEAAFTLPERREPVGVHAIPRVGIYPGNREWTLRIKDARWYLPARTLAAFPPLQRAGRALIRAARRDG
jgi:peptidoglycan/xylan/chitin deacetylase (PgdA/CDA1 family)